METTVVTSDAPGGIAGRRGFTCRPNSSRNASAIRVRQPGPVAFQRATVSGRNRIEIDVRALPDFGDRRLGADILGTRSTVCTRPLLLLLSVNGQI